MIKAQIPDHKMPNKTQIDKTQSTNTYKYRDLEERTFRFAKRCRDYVKKFPKTISSIEYGRQLIRSSGSQAANYIEANESIWRKDFAHRIRICRKESKESGLWLELSEPNDTELSEKDSLIQESKELRSIFSAILAKSDSFVFS